MMRFLGNLPLVAVLLLSSQGLTPAQQRVNAEDSRYKADILIVVAHPDDEAFFTPYAAKAINEMQKKVAVIFSTRGGSGVNRFTRERGPAMANEREIEAREACAKLGIKNVWFLDGKDTASQNVLNSLASWGHGANLERMVGFIRLTRPEVIMTHYPGFFIGENHGDHQATGVLVIEAFDLAADPAVFPSQLAGEMQHYEVYLSNLQPWQAKKIYFGSDATDGKQFAGSGPTYSVREVSPSLKKSYWRLALDSAMSHRTQFPDFIDQLSKMSDQQLEKMMNDPNSEWWEEPSTLIFGKSAVGGKPTDDVFAHIEEKAVLPTDREGPACETSGAPNSKETRVALGGAWLFYSEFYPAHALCHLRVAPVPEIAVKAGTTLVVPLFIRHEPSKPSTLNINVKAPDDWKVSNGDGKFTLPAESSSTIPVHIETPALAADQLKSVKPQEVAVIVELEGHPAGEIHLRVLLRSSGLPQ